MGLKCFALSFQCRLYKGEFLLISLDSDTSFFQCILGSLQIALRGDPYLQ